jgi:nucleoside-diphosphate-sugar epimerase
VKVLVTGAFGNAGHSALTELLAQGDRVRAFDLRTRANLRAARRFGDRIEVCWGDIRNPPDLARAVADVDAVAHIAFVIPPESERRPEWAREINVTGTGNLIAAMQACPRPPRLVYTSSVSVTGPRGPEDEPPVTAVHPTKASDAYTTHKIETEAMVRGSSLEWIILRLGAVLPLELPMRFDPITFEIPEDQRVEFVHTRDVGLAVANAVRCDEALGRILLIGGGERCRLRMDELRARMGRVFGMPSFPASAFSRAPYYTDFMDTGEAERLLHFQRHDFEDYLAELRSTVPRLVPLVLRLLGRPIARRLLERSPYYQAQAG